MVIERRIIHRNLHTDIAQRSTREGGELETLLHASPNRLQVRVHLAWRVSIGPVLPRTTPAVDFPRLRKIEEEDLPGGDPRMRETIASRAILMFCTDPKMWMFLYYQLLRDLRSSSSRFCEDDTRSASVFDGEFDLSALTRDTA